MPYRFRFSIGQVMGVIALSALLMANAIFVTQGNFTFYIVLVAAILFAGLGVLLYNRRLSRWMWVWIAGQSGPAAPDDPTGVAKSALFSLHLCSNPNESVFSLFPPHRRGLCHDVSRYPPKAGYL